MRETPNGVWHTTSTQNTIRKITTLAVLLTLSGCASGPGTRPLPRPSGPVEPCPAYANFETARLPDGRGWLQVMDSIARTPKAQERSRRLSAAEIKQAEHEVNELFGVTITHPARVPPGARTHVARLLEQTYPPELRDSGRGGTVYMVMLMDPSGRVRETLMARSSGFPTLDAAALRVARQVTLDPAIAGNCSVPYIAVLPITYMVATPTNPGPRP